MTENIDVRAKETDAAEGTTSDVGVNEKMRDRADKALEDIRRSRAETRQREEARINGREK